MTPLFWSVVAQVGFWGWLAGSAGFILTVFPHRGSFRATSAVRWGAPLLFCYLLWAVGMLKA